MSKFEQAIRIIDQKNAEDPHKEFYKDTEYPKELLYSERMSQKLLNFQPDASEELQLAARAQHICRWKFPRDRYPMDRPGYLKWRQELKKKHAEITADILKEVGYDEDFIQRVSFLIQKKRIKKDKESQVMEDVVCLVFLQYYFEDFAEKLEDDKLPDVIRKTWAKMSAEGHEAALQLPLPPENFALIKKALA